MSQNCVNIRKDITISSLNIQGLKKYHGENSFLSYCKNFDIIALYETWQENENDFENFLDGYAQFHYLRPKKRTAFRGSGGVAVFVKDWLMKTSGISRIFNTFRECIVLHFNADIFRRTSDLIMVFTYVPPENSPVYTNEDNGIILLNEQISEISVQYPYAELFLAGDLNSRIGNLQDFIPFDDLHFVFGDTEYPTDMFNINRRSKDETCNRFGTSLIDLCCTHNIHTLNGRVSEDINGEITCIANNGRSVVDYMLASSSLFGSFTHFRVSSEDFSDHFPLHCSFSLYCENNANNGGDLLTNETWSRYKWKDNRISELHFHFLQNHIASYEDVLLLLSDFLCIYKKAGKCMKMKGKRKVKC